MVATGRSDQAVRAAETTLRVLEVVAFSEEELGVTQIADRLGLTKGAVFRHLHGLVERGYLIRESDDGTLSARREGLFDRSVGATRQRPGRLR